MPPPAAQAQPVPAPPAPTPPVPTPPTTPPAPAEPLEIIALEPGDDPIVTALGKGDPSSVESLAVHEHGRRRIVLYRVDPVAQWQASRDDAETLLEPLDALIEACESSYGDVDAECVAKEAASRMPGVPAEIVRHAATEASAWELADLRIATDTKVEVMQRRRLFEQARACTEDCFELKLKVYDMDGDGRSEVLAVFPLVVSSEHGAMGSSHSALAFVLDEVDFHVQFATTRQHYDQGGDLSSHELDVETTFMAKDTNADGHPDLALREKGSSSRSEEGEDSERTPIEASATCLYERAGDRWVCDKTLGKQLIDGGRLLETTRVPLPPAAP